MSDVILVVLERPEAAVHLLHAAECLAVLTGGAHVNVLAMRTPPGYAALTAEANLTGGLLDALAEEEERRVAKLEAVYNSWVDGAEEAPFTARWTSVEGLADPVLGTEGRRGRGDQNIPHSSGTWSGWLPAG